MNKIFVYGKLKKNFFNHTKYGFNMKTKFIKNAILEGYLMYNLGGKPCIVETKDKRDIVVGEIYEYFDSDCERAIKRMEEDAGFKETIVTIDGAQVKTFVFDRKPNNHVIKEGIWR
ncbi:MAG: gamma-glutamylcyclotransferase family protein [Candidatus Woesearchaeota archaeon]